MTVQRVSAAQSELDKLITDYEAAAPYLSTLRVALTSMSAIANMQALNFGSSHQDRDLWTGRGKGYAEAEALIDQCYHDNVARLERTIQDEQVRFEAESGNADAAGKPAASRSDEADIYEDDDL